MTRDDYLDEMQQCINNSDTEEAHIDADRILCNLLVQLGYGDVVDLWYEVEKWYS